MFIDAHNHLQDLRLCAQQHAIFEALARVDLGRAVVNGTQESDWPAVAALAAACPWILPAFGLHPWCVQTRSARWQENLLAHLDAQPQASIGEVGLDRWIQPHDFPLQCDIFKWQVALAAHRNLPLTIHCLKAWGALWEILSQYPLPRRGFLLHAYSGPQEMVEGFCIRGGFFSFSTHFLHPRNARQRAVFESIPLDRLLVETDAPDMTPPESQNWHPLQDPSGAPINHPANIALAYEGLAQLRSIPLSTLCQQVECNFLQLFGCGCPAGAPIELI